MYSLNHHYYAEMLVGNDNKFRDSVCWLWQEKILYDQLTHLSLDKMSDIFKCIFFNENIWISIKISLKFDAKGSNNYISALV